jgi:hypothetical protein
MKKSLLLAVAFGLALSACTKKNEGIPGANLDAKKQSDQGTEAKPKAVIAPNPEKPLVGSWQSPCVKETKTIQTNGHTTDIYESYRSFLTIEDGVMTEEFFRFKGVFCDPNYEHLAVRMGSTDVWEYSIVEKGEQNGKKFLVDFLYVSAGISEPTSGEVEYATKEIESVATETLRFENEETVYSRRPNK